MSNEITSTFAMPLPTGTDDDILINIRRIYGNLNLSADHLQFWCVALVRDLEGMSKKDAKVHPALEFLFKNSPKGMDRGTLAAWFKAYTPLRIRFEGETGHFKGIGWAKQGKWDVDGAIENPWYTVDPERTRNLRKPDIAKKLAQVIREAAKLVAISDDLDAAQAAEAIKAAVRDARQDIEKEMNSEAVSTFVDAWADQSVTMH